MISRRSYNWQSLLLGVRGARYPGGHELYRGASEPQRLSMTHTVNPITEATQAIV